MTDSEKTGAEEPRKNNIDKFDLDEFKNSFIKRKRTAMRNKLTKKLRSVSILLIISLAGASFFAVRTAVYYIELTQNRHIHEKAAEIANRQTPASAEPAEVFEQQAPPKPQDVLDTQALSGPQDVLDTQALSRPEDIIYTDEIPVERPILGKITELRREFSNDNIVGYLSIEGTNINYAVAQYTDNEFYLNRDLYGNENSAGSIFMDYENSVEQFDDNTIIYGHNMANGSMFHNLRYYANELYFKDNPLIYLTTAYEETVWEVFAFYKTDIDFYYIQTSFEDREQFKGLISQMLEKSMHTSATQVGADDKILTLSTCSDKSGNSRFVLNAKLLTN